MIRGCFLLACLLTLCLNNGYGQFTEVAPLFESAPELDKPYGVCAHVTFPGWENYDSREKTLKMATELGVNIIRTDWLSTLCYSKDGKFSPDKIDVLAKDFKAYNMSMLPLLDRHVVGVYGWNDLSLYVNYVDSLLTRYPQYEYWELMNEVDLIFNLGTEAEMAQRYLSVVKKVCEVVHSHNKKIVFGGVAHANGEFVKSFLDNGGAQYIDVFNFHSYSSGVTPEGHLYGDLKQLTTRLDRNTEIWVTETGYHTEEPNSYMPQFFCRILPRALSKLNINEGDTIAVVNTVNEQLPEFLMASNYRVKYVSIADIDNLDVNSVRALLPCDREIFPSKYFPKLLSYVRDGGTIILPYGVPFYYDLTEEGKIVPSQSDYRAMLHMFVELWWEASFKSTGLPKDPSVLVKNPDYSDLWCSWVSNGEGTTRYFSGRRLKEGDSLVPIISLGDSTTQYPICGIYQYGSDLKGNCIFNTYLGEIYSVPETLKAKRVARSYIYGISRGISKMFWYELKHGGNNKFESEHNFGLANADTSPRPAYEAYKFLTRMMPSGSSHPILYYDDNTHIYKASWNRPDRKVVEAYWTIQGRGEVVIKKKRSTRVYNYLGNRIQLSGKVLPVDNGVVYVVR